MSWVITQTSINLKILEIIQSMFSDHNKIKLETNSGKKRVKSVNMWKLSSTFTKWKLSSTFTSTFNEMLKIHRTE